MRSRWDCGLREARVYAYAKGAVADAMPQRSFPAPLTLDEIAEFVGVSRQEVQRVETYALRKLRWRARALIDEAKG